MEQPTQNSWITFHIPEDGQLLAALGKISVAHGQLDHVLRMTVKTLADVSIRQAMDATSYDSSSSLRERIRKLARHRLGEGSALIKLQAFMRRCECVTKKRNNLVHCVWARELDGNSLMHTNDHGWKPILTVTELEALATEIHELTIELNTERLNGFLSAALAVKKNG